MRFFAHFLLYTVVYYIHPERTARLHLVFYIPLQLRYFYVYYWSVRQYRFPVYLHKICSNRLWMYISIFIDINCKASLWFTSLPMSLSYVANRGHLGVGHSNCYINSSSSKLFITIVFTWIKKINVPPNICKVTVAVNNIINTIGH